MSKNTSVILGEHFEKFVGSQIAGGRYNSTSEVVRAGLRVLEEEEIKLEALRAAIVEGDESPDSDVSMQELFEVAQKEVAKKRG